MEPMIFVTRFPSKMNRDTMYYQLESAVMNTFTTSKKIMQPLQDNTVLSSFVILRVTTTGGGYSLGIGFKGASNWGV